MNVLTYERADSKILVRSKEIEQFLNYLQDQDLENLGVSKVVLSLVYPSISLVALRKLERQHKIRYCKITKRWYNFAPQQKSVEEINRDLDIEREEYEDLEDVF